MKTPMQELIDRLKTLQNLYEEGQPQHNVFGTTIQLAESLLEKEKEVITEAFLEGKLDGWQNQWADPNDYYNETFNTKEK